MRIVSKYKDYYDYLQGKYGIDPLRVYVRHSSIPKKDDAGNRIWEKAGMYVPPFLDDKYFYGNEFKKSDYHCEIIAIAGTIYVVYYYHGKFWRLTS